MLGGLYVWAPKGTSLSLRSARSLWEVFKPSGSASWLELAHPIRAALAQHIPIQEHPGPWKAARAPRSRSIQEHPRPPRSINKNTPPCNPGALQYHPEKPEAPGTPRSILSHEYQKHPQTPWCSPGVPQLEQSLGPPQEHRRTPGSFLEAPPGASQEHTRRTPEAPRSTRTRLS